MNVTTSNQVSSGVDAYFSTELLDRPQPWHTYGLFAEVKDLPSKMSGVIRFRKYGSLAAATTALTEGVKPAGSLLSKTDSTATVAQLNLAVPKFSLISQFLSLQPVIAL